MRFFIIGCVGQSLTLIVMCSDQEEQLWVWQYEAEDGTHDMFMDIEEAVRFRVVEEVFVDTLPTNSKA